ncbi:hypothetical protein D3C71_325420 [compost metagenome]
MKKLVLFFSLVLSVQWLNAQCECINGGTNVVANHYVMYPIVSGDFINRNSSLYNLDLEDGKDYRIIMRHLSGNYICSNPAMAVQNFSAGSNNYSFDFTFDAASWNTFQFFWVFYSGVQPGMTESFEFEIRKKILGIYYEQHTFNYTVNAICNEYSTFLYTNTTHGVAKYEVNDYLSFTSAASNFYSDGTMNFDAGNYVNFGPGFSTGLGTYEAYIDGCNGLKSAPHEENDSPIGSLLSNSSDFEVYPNPVEKYVTIEFADKSERGVSILDESGRTLNDYQIGEHDNIQIDLSHLNTGIYLIKVTRSDGAVVVKRIVKQ